MPSIVVQKVTGALTPIKLDGKIYIVSAGSYSMMENEKIIAARHTANGAIDMQRVETSKHRWSMTLMVPTSTDNVTLIDASFSASDMGTLSDLQTTCDKLAPSDLLDFYDIDSEWDFSGAVPYNVYVDGLDFQSPNNNDIGLWQVPITLWGKDA